MPWQDIALWLLGISCAVSGWFLRTIWYAVEDLRRHIGALENNLPNVYARRDDVREMFNQVLGAINDLRGRLDNRADRRSTDR